MDKTKLIYWTDVGMGISFLVVAITGFLKLDEPRNFMFVHDWSGILMSVFVLIHLILHWNWIVCMTKNILKEKESCVVKK